MGIQEKIRGISPPGSREMMVVTKAVGIAMAMAVIAGSRNQPLDFGLREVPPRPDFSIRPPPGWTVRPLDCPINSAWRDQRQTRPFH